MTSFYLDSNILIAYFSSHPSESTKKKEASDALAVFAQAKGVQLCTSLWSVAEMMNVLIHGKQMDRGAVFEIESRLLGESRLANLKLHFLEVARDRITTSRSFSFTSGKASSNIIPGSGT